MTFTNTSELRDALLSSYPDAAYFGAPVIGVNRDDTGPAWEWVIKLARMRTDWWPALGIALQHAAQDGGDLARGALADLLEAYQHSIVLLEWTEPMAALWPDARATCRGTTFGDPDYRLGTIVVAQRALWDPTQKESRISLEGVGPDGGWVVVDVKTQADLESLMAMSAKAGKHGDGGHGPWYWLLDELLFHHAMEPMVVAACAKFAGGTDAEVRSMLDWFADDHDLWRYIDLLEGWSRTPPPWWNEPAGVTPPGWRFPIRSSNAKTLGDVALGALARGRDQAAKRPVIDLVPIFGGRAA